MVNEDAPRFLRLLADLGILFADEVTKDRQELYWRTLHGRITIDEWEYACNEAMIRQDFHKVPMPKVLLEYAMEYRRRVEALHAETAAQKRLALNPPRQGAGDPEENLRNVAALIASVWLGEAARAQEPAMRSTLHQAYRAPSQRDPEARKVELRAQLEQLEKEQRADGENDVA